MNRIRRLRPSLRLRLWRLLHPKKWGKQRKLWATLDEMHDYRPRHNVCPVCNRARVKEAVTLQEIIAYIDRAIDERDHGSVIWRDENGGRFTTDVGYAAEWWACCMKPELLRVFGEEAQP